MKQETWKEFRKKFEALIRQMRDEEECWCHEQKLEPTESSYFIIGIKGDHVELLNVMCGRHGKEEPTLWRDLINVLNETMNDCIRG